MNSSCYVNQGCAKQSLGAINTILAQKVDKANDTKANNIKVLSILLCTRYKFINEDRQNVSTHLLTDQYDSQYVTDKIMQEQTSWFHVLLDCVRVT